MPAARTDNVLVYFFLVVGQHAGSCPGGWFVLVVPQRAHNIRGIQIAMFEGHQDFIVDLGQVIKTPFPAGHRGGDPGPVAGQVGVFVLGQPGVHHLDAPQVFWVFQAGYFGGDNAGDGIFFMPVVLVQQVAQGIGRAAGNVKHDLIGAGLINMARLGDVIITAKAFAYPFDRHDPAGDQARVALATNAAGLDEFAFCFCKAGRGQGLGLVYRSQVLVDDDFGSLAPKGSFCHSAALFIEANLRDRLAHIGCGGCFDGCLCFWVPSFGKGLIHLVNQA